MEESVIEVRFSDHNSFKQMTRAPTAVSVFAVQLLLPLARVGRDWWTIYGRQILWCSGAAAEEVREEQVTGEPPVAV